MQLDGNVFWGSNDASASLPDLWMGQLNHFQESEVVCFRLRPFGTKVLALRRSAWGQAADASAEALLDRKGAWSDMASFAADADIIIVACSQDSSSFGFVNDSLIAACKPGVIIVNVARGTPFQKSNISCSKRSPRLSSQMLWQMPGSALICRLLIDWSGLVCCTRWPAQL